jgi:hypothetical protein
MLYTKQEWRGQEQQRVASERKTLDSGHRRREERLYIRYSEQGKQDIEQKRRLYRDLGCCTLYSERRL